MKEILSNCEVVPILSDLRAIYDLERQMERYWAYVNLMTKDRGEILPLGDFSPMGNRQIAILDHLINLKTEEYIRASTALVRICDSYRVIIVVVDEPKNGWTQRYLTDFSQMMSDPKLWAGQQSANRKWWVPVYLWTTNFKLQPVFPSLKEVESLTIVSVRRTQWKLEHGVPVSLREIIAQEIWANRVTPLESMNQDEYLATISKHLDAHDYPTVVAALYGDEAAGAVGYEPLGLGEKSVLTNLPIFAGQFPQIR